MIHWKNRPIDDLSETELRAAMAETMMHVFKDAEADVNTKVFQAFIFGTFTGLFVATLAISIGTYL